MRVLLRLGVSPPHTYLLTVRGRKNGHPYSTPVTLVKEAGKRWLVAPYGEVGWVRNARAAEQVTLTRSRRFETVRIQEISAEEAAPMLKKYLAQVPVYGGSLTYTEVKFAGFCCRSVTTSGIPDPIATSATYRDIFF